MFRIYILALVVCIRFVIVACLCELGSVRKDNLIGRFHVLHSEALSDVPAQCKCGFMVELQWLRGLTMQCGSAAHEDVRSAICLQHLIPKYGRFMTYH